MTQTITSASIMFAQARPRSTAFRDPLTVCSVVVGVDTSTSRLGYQTMEWAARHANRLGVDLQVFRIGEANGGGLAEDELIQRVIRALPSLTVHFRGDTSDPVTAVCTTASGAGAMIVIGGSGRPGVLSSPVSQLLQHRSCDVALIRGTGRAIRGQYGFITACFDGDPQDVAVLLSAIRLCRSSGARLRLLHVRPPHPNDIGPATGASCPALREMVRLTRLIAPDIQPEVKVDTRHHHEAVSDQLGDVLVVGHGRQDDRTASRAFRRTVVHHASCPVLFTAPGFTLPPGIEYRP